MAAWAGWAADVLRAGSWPVSDANVQFLNAWQGYEQSACRNNPLNTTLHVSGSTTCNFAGVQSYDTSAIGAKATVDTLRNGHYPALVAALASGDPYTYTDPSGVAANVTTWGTPNFAASYLLAAGSVGGSGATAPPHIGGTGTGPNDPHAYSGWNDLQNSFNKHLTRQLRKSRELSSIALRSLGRRTKVGR